MVFVIGLPIFFSELFVGQYSGLGPNKAYANLAPLFQGNNTKTLYRDTSILNSKFSGLGYCNLIVITSGIIYYMVILAWIIFYLYESFQPTLGWSHCNHEFNTISNLTFSME